MSRPQQSGKLTPVLQLHVFFRFHFGDPRDFLPALIGASAGYSPKVDRTNNYPHMSPLLGARTLLGAPGLTTRSEDATRGSWPY